LSSSLVIARLDRAIQFFYWPGRALLDHPVKPDDDKKGVVWTVTKSGTFLLFNNNTSS
jgi:hypothetical protein